MEEGKRKKGSKHKRDGAREMRFASVRRSEPKVHYKVVLRILYHEG
jgi:hypothetical protein